MITTVIPTYRRPRLLARAIRSVLRQAYADLRVIVYDNASADETASVVGELAAEDNRVFYHAHASNIGALGNINFALTRIDSEFFSVLSDDDVLLPHLYQQAVQTFTAYPGAVFVASPVILVDEEGRVRKVAGSDWPPGLHPPPGAMLRIAAREHFIWTGTVFRREALEQGMLDPETGGCSDLDFLLRIAGSHPIAVAPRPGAVFYVHRESPSSFPRLSLYWPSWTKIIANAGRDEAIAVTVRAAVQQALDRRLARMLFQVGIFSSSRGYYAEAEEAATVLQARYQSTARAALVRGVAGICGRAPTIRGLIAAAIARLRWPRRHFRREQRELDRENSGWLETGAAPVRKDAAA